MIPIAAAQQLMRGTREYVRTTFPFANEPFKSSFDRYASTPGKLVHEPFTAVRLPFKAQDDYQVPFDAVKVSFAPYTHQAKAWERLCAKKPRSTLVATGTGSGKTESFLYPILDWCWRHRGEPGIKAILIYPMNALAQDQATRIAGQIYNNLKLRDNVTAGLYVGSSGYGFENSASVMGQDHVITSRDVLLQSPPDILLTNYKMLDLLLLRPGEQGIWEGSGPDSLRFVVVDEMHTFDGAQGTDLACLLRRLKDRLSIQQGHLCCIGTSATMGDEQEAPKLRAYAEDLFGEVFDAGSLIVEDRQSVEDYLKAQNQQEERLPTAAQEQALADALENNDCETYLSVAAQSFFGNLQASIESLDTRMELGRRLPGLRLFREYLRAAQGGFRQSSELIEHDPLSHDASFQALSNPAGALDALISLIAYARAGTLDHPYPFLDVQVQLWATELRRFVASVDPDTVQFDIAVNLDLSIRNQVRYLPLVNCRDCGQTAWVGESTSDQHLQVASLESFYNNYFSKGSSVLAAYPRNMGEQFSQNLRPGWYCPHCGKYELELGERTSWRCPECDSQGMAVFLADLSNSQTRKGQYVCPCCGSDKGLSLVGLRNTTEAETTISQLFLSNFEDQPKALVFSDSVQDASYRSGFINGRTWRFGLRAAMAEYLAIAKKPITVARFIEEYGPAAIETHHMSREEVAARFCPPNCMWLQAYEDMVRNGHLTNDKYAKGLLREVIPARLRYEGLLEVGMRAHVGRTLEKSGVLAIGYNRASLEEAAKCLEQILREEEGAVLISHFQAMRLLISLLDVVRSQGAFADGIYDQFIAEGARSWFISQRRVKWMPGNRAEGIPLFPVWGTESPKGFCSFGDPQFLDAMRQVAGSSLPGLLVGDRLLGYGTLSYYVARAAAQTGLLVTVGKNGAVGLSEELTLVHPETQLVRCDSCGRIQTVPSLDVDLWEGSHCVHKGCNGVLNRCSQSNNYYKGLFTQGLRERVRSEEHTGLLENEDRSRVEGEFKASGDQRRPWYPNVLSCTPTLEMGIDIGDLSSLVLCGMPPGQAQFLQRVGRAGRRDGNALVAVLADATPTGQHYYQAPSEMFDGVVEPPRIYLGATAVLERQLIAFCLERWVQHVGVTAGVPKTIKHVLNNIAAEKVDKHSFPFSYLAYVKQHENELLKGFLYLFGSVLETEKHIEPQLLEFMRGKSSEEAPMRVRVLEAFQHRAELRQTFREQLQEMNKIAEEIRKLPKDPTHDEKIKDAEREATALRNAIQSIEKEDTFGFLSREGLIPNYAFPEEGANLRVVMKRAPVDGEEPHKKRCVKENREYSRAAASALSDFAPGNTFYVDGHHVNIDQIDVRGSQIQTWRLCPDCSHAEPETNKTPKKACPKCHSTAWADRGQLRQMLKLKTVMANVDYVESLNDDSTDHRSVKFYDRQLLVDVDSSAVTSAYSYNSSSMTFGYDYAPLGHVQELNCGPAGDRACEESAVAGSVRRRPGFKVCRYCGKVFSDHGEDKRKENHKHLPFCRVNRNPELEAESIVDCLFLYRDMETEVLRLLVPETSAIDETESIIPSFEAAVLLGLRKRFGNVEHIGMSLCEEPVPESGYRKRFIALYDTVPGGTGYLKTLAEDAQQMREVLKASYDAMASCACGQDEESDGCYACLYSARRGLSNESVSRRVAMGVLEKILACDEVERVQTIDELSLDPIFDSELEKMFLDALLGAKSPSGALVQFHKEIVGAKTGYHIDVDGSHWDIEPQVDLGPEDGIAVACRPDFVIYPTEKGDTRKPVAIFTDGFEFHRDRVADDSLKREALIRSGSYVVWSLSYDDVIKGRSQEAKDYTDLFDGLINRGMYDKARENCRSKGPVLNLAGSFCMLLDYLGREDSPRLFEDAAQAIAFGYLKPKSGEPRIPNTINTLAEQLRTVSWNEIEGLISSEYQGEGVRLGFSVFVGASYQGVSSWHTESVVAIFDDRDELARGFKPLWNGLLNFTNLMQFHPGFIWITELGLEEEIYRVLDANLDADVHLLTEGQGDWESLLAEAVNEARNSGEMLSRLGVRAPDEVGYELDNGEMAEFVWHKEKVAVLTPDLIDDKNAFEQEGFSVFVTDDDAATIAEQIKSEA